MFGHPRWGVGASLEKSQPPQPDGFNYRPVHQFRSAVPTTDHQTNERKTPMTANTSKKTPTQPASSSCSPGRRRQEPQESGRRRRRLTARSRGQLVSRRARRRPRRRRPTSPLVLDEVASRRHHRQAGRDQVSARKASSYTHDDDQEIAEGAVDSPSLAERRWLAIASLTEVRGGPPDRRWGFCTKQLVVPAA